ncbi:MAG: hypothetical protein AB7U83_24170 [Vicinamibacterales bacterium]
MSVPRRPGGHGRWLWGLLGLFLVRVAAQPLALIGVAPWLPPFDAWQSGALSYPTLLAAQLGLAAAMAWAAAGVSAGRTRPRPTAGRRLAGLAALYGTVMTTRLVLGATLARGHWWLDAPLPTLFHLVLTTWLAVYGHYHLRGDADTAPR